MECPHCGHAGSRVIETRENREKNLKRRRRECVDCGDRFTTYERVETPSLSVVKSGGEEESFQTEKLKEGIERACKKRPVSQEEIEEVVDEIEMELKSSGRKKIESREIGDMVINRLKDIDEVSYLRFASVYNSFEDVSAFEDEVQTLKNS